MLDEVRISGNTGWQGGIGCPYPCHAPLRGQTNGDPWPGAGWLALLDTAEPATLGCMRLGTIEADRVPTRNLLNLASFGQLHALDASTALPTLDKLDEYDGDQVWQWTNPSHSGAGLLLGWSRANRETEVLRGRADRTLESPTCLSLQVEEQTASKKRARG